MADLKMNQTEFLESGNLGTKMKNLTDVLGSRQNTAKQSINKLENGSEELSKMQHKEKKEKQ